MKVETLKKQPQILPPTAMHRFPLLSHGIHHGEIANPAKEKEGKEESVLCQEFER
ncbi:hypothetical protein D8674_002900 [Pyrus ussuriensis x Pyrus communis]|uniref:Uncharacterized protein n=1 Tax=Pyrus ussuriensis x Pyrus communis TaxID=2448454 RepID=A0A5N5FFK5_9ROSA|nr:hypothetical protein D8674_002900 [Pyrus ussuriensis x Pyrus communis]